MGVKVGGGFGRELHLTSQNSKPEIPLGDAETNQMNLVQWVLMVVLLKFTKSKLDIGLFEDLWKRFEDSLTNSVHVKLFPTDDLHDM